jgi:type IV pilus assembly protein PilW
MRRPPASLVAARSARRGFTLIEVMVGMVIGLLLTTAAVAFVRSESKLMGVTEDRLDMVQASRVVMNLVSSDVRSAGLGLRPQNGEFQGLLTGPFTVGGVPYGGAGSLQLEEADASSFGTFSSYAVPTQDLGVRLADGDQATIVDFTGKGSTAGTLTVCDHAGMELRNGEIVLLQDQTSLSTWSVELTNVGASSLCAGTCRNGCMPLSWQEPSSAGHQYEANAGADQEYGLGQMFSGFQTVVWFVVPDPDRADRGALRRMTWDDTQPDCGARDNNCGALVARNVEGFFYRVYQFTPAGGWVEIAPGTNPTADGRVRIDIELVLRADEVADKTFPQVQALLPPGGPVAFPQNPRDRIERRVFRATVELRNAGRI